MGVIYGIFGAALFVFPAYLITTMINSTPKKREAAWVEACNRGHRVTAVLKRRSVFRRDVPGITTGRVRQGVYEYTWGNRTYKYRFWAYDLPNTLSLFFLTNPRKAVVKEALCAKEVNWWAIYFCVAAVLSLVMST